MARPLRMRLPRLPWVSLALMGCTQSVPTPTWSLLSEGQVVRVPAAEDLEQLNWGGLPVQWKRSSEGLGLRLRVQVPASVWTSLGKGIYWAPRPLGDQSTPQLALPLSLSSGEIELPLLELVPGFQRRLDELGDAPIPEDLLVQLAAAREGLGMCSVGSRILVAVGADEAPPAGLWLEEPVPLAQDVDGRSRIRVGGLTADGVSFLPGSPVTLGSSQQAGRVLRYTTVAMGRALPDGELDSAHASSLQFVLRCGERELQRTSQPLRANPQPVEHEVTLPAGLDLDAEITLEAEGPLGLAAVLMARLTPGDIARIEDTGGARPWGAASQDLVLFIADTFRADNMLAWGGDPNLTPNLNRFANQSRRYLQTQSPATWTLPAHASFFSGLYPPQLGVMTETDVLPSAAWTLAEHLREAGYRTAAVTEAAYLSASFGMAQGFEWFEEHTSGLQHTLDRAEALLANDDGRPLFLVVHTYAVHAPYDVSRATRDRLGQQYSFARDQDAVIPELASVWQSMQRGLPTSEAGAPKVQAFENLYRGGAADLDLGFQTWLDFLEARRFTERGLLIFLSDHGEAFGEHGSFGHGSAVWQEQARVPFLLNGPGIEPESVSEPTSLIDLPRTVSSLLGLEPHPGWMGRNITGDAEPAPVFTFQTRKVGGFNDWAVTHGDTKWILPLAEGEQVAPDEAHWIYDLGLDAGENNNLGGQGDSPALEGDLLELMQLVRKRLLDAGDSLQLSPAERARLKALGYAGED